MSTRSVSRKASSCSDMCMCMSMCICMCVCMCIYMCMCVCVCVCACMWHVEAAQHLLVAGAQRVRQRVLVLLEVASLVDEAGHAGRAGQPPNGLSGLSGLSHRSIAALLRVRCRRLPLRLTGDLMVVVGGTARLIDARDPTVRQSLHATLPCVALLLVALLLRVFLLLAVAALVVALLLCDGQSRALDAAERP